MTSYIIKSILCSGILLLCYHLFLEKEKMFRFNRFYLLVSVIFSLIIPLITIEVTEQLRPVPEYIPYIHQQKEAAMTEQLISSDTNSDRPNNTPVYIYCLITCTLLVRFGKNLFYLLCKRKRNEVVILENSRLVLLPENIVTFTFLNYIFVSKKAYQDNLIEEEVLIHEMAHASQKHSLDIVLMEIVQALVWFNPLLFFYKKSVQLNHEFLADEAVLKTKTNVKNYQLLLLDKILYTRQINLTSSFNYSITKKRLAMMTKTSDFSRQVIKQSGIAVMAFGLAFVFCDKVYAQVEKKQSQIKTKSTTYGSVTAGKGLSSDLLEEFNSTVKNNSQKKKTPSGKPYLGIDLTAKQTKRLYDLYQEMSLAQKKNTNLEFFEMPLPVKQSPSSADFELWKNPAVVGVWINEKKVSNKELDQYESSDIAEYSISKLYGAAKKGRTYKYQLDLTTNDYFDKTYQKRAEDRIIIVEKRTFAGKAGK